MNFNILQVEVLGGEKGQRIYCGPSTSKNEQALMRQEYTHH